jgi:hypothetical protein
MKRNRLDTDAVPVRWLLLMGRVRVWTLTTCLLCLLQLYQDDSKVSPNGKPIYVRSRVQRTLSVPEPDELPVKNGFRVEDALLVATEKVRHFQQYYRTCSITRWCIQGGNPRKLYFRVLEFTSRLPMRLIARVMERKDRDTILDATDWLRRSLSASEVRIGLLYSRSMN